MFFDFFVPNNLEPQNLFFPKPIIEKRKVSKGNSGLSCQKVPVLIGYCAQILFKIPILTKGNGWQVSASNTLAVIN